MWLGDLIQWCWITTCKQQWQIRNHIFIVITHSQSTKYVWWHFDRLFIYGTQNGLEIYERKNNKMFLLKNLKRMRELKQNIKWREKMFAVNGYFQSQCGMKYYLQALVYFIRDTIRYYWPETIKKVMETKNRWIIVTIFFYYSKTLALLVKNGWKVSTSWFFSSTTKQQQQQQNAFWLRIVKSEFHEKKTQNYYITNNARTF